MVVQKGFVKQLFLKISQCSQENTCARVSILMKVASLSLQLYLKKTDTGVCLWILRNFWKYLYLHKTSVDCFWRKAIFRPIFSLKSSENLWFSHDFRVNRSQFICLNSLNIRSAIWRQSLNRLGLTVAYFIKLLIKTWHEFSLVRRCQRFYLSTNKYFC